MRLNVLFGRRIYLPIITYISNHPIPVLSIKKTQTPIKYVVFCFDFYVRVFWYDITVCPIISFVRVRTSGVVGRGVSGW